MAIFDARAKSEFSGDNLRTNKRGRPYLKARLLPHQALLHDGSLMLPGALRRMIFEAGFRSGDAFVTQCQGGGRAALAAIAALHAGLLIGVE